MPKDIRKEQLALLRFEKKLTGLAVFVAASSATAASAGEKINAAATGSAYEAIKAALVQLADVTTGVHALLEASAIEAGARVLEASGGIPKEPRSAVIRSLLGIG